MWQLRTRVLIAAAVAAGTAVNVPAAGATGNAVANGGHCLSQAADLARTADLSVSDVVTGNSPSTGFYTATETPAGDVHTAQTDRSIGTGRCYFTP